MLALSSFMARATGILLRGLMTDKAIELDEHRGMAAQKATDLRRLLAEVEANEAALRLRQDELESQLIAAPAANWKRPPGRRAIFSTSLLLRCPRRTHAGKRSSRRFSLIFSGSRPDLSAQRAIASPCLHGPNIGFNRETTSWHSIFPIEAAPTTRHGGSVRFWGYDGPMEAAFS